MTPGSCCLIELAKISLATDVKDTFLGALSLFFVATLMTQLEGRAETGSRQ